MAKPTHTRNQTLTSRGGEKDSLETSDCETAYPGLSSEVRRRSDRAKRKRRKSLLSRRELSSRRSRKPALRRRKMKSSPSMRRSEPRTY